MKGVSLKGIASCQFNVGKVIHEDTSKFWTVLLCKYKDWIRLSISTYTIKKVLINWN